MWIYTTKNSEILNYCTQGTIEHKPEHFGTPDYDKMHQISMFVHSESAQIASFLPVTHSHTKVITFIVYGCRSRKTQKEHFTGQPQAASSSQRNKIPPKSINGFLKRSECRWGGSKWVRVQQEMWVVVMWRSLRLCCGVQTCIQLGGHRWQADLVTWSQKQGEPSITSTSH